MNTISLNGHFIRSMRGMAFLSLALSGSTAVALAEELDIDSIRQVFAATDLPVVNEPKAIYGDDDRQELRDAKPAFQQVARSVAALFARNELAVNLRGRWQLPDSPVLAELEWCAEERFSTQTATAKCSGFLLSPSHLLTSAHCVRSEVDRFEDGLSCSNLAVIFDYSMPENGHPFLAGLDSEQVFFCKSLLGRFLDPSGADWSVIELDRKVEGRDALALYEGNSFTAGAVMSVIGHPLGLPAKVSSKGRVLDQSGDSYFVTDLDTYAGNSGSPVFVQDVELDTLKVAGILSRGDLDFERVVGEDGQTCLTSRRCDVASCQGEQVTRITEVPSLDEFR